MKRTPALILAGLMLIGSLALPAGAFDLPEQSVKGTIAAPVPSNVTGVPRRAFLVSRATNGLIGYAFDVDATTIGGPFDLKATSDPTAQGDLNIFFYSDPGTVADQPPVIVGEFSTAAVGGERGVVPEEAKIAMVFISGGAGVSFDYKATPPPVVTLADGAVLDAAIRTGGIVQFVNSTDAVAYVRHLPAAAGAKPEFTSDPDGIAPGATFSVSLSTAGTYAYESSVGNGTITVAD